MINSQNIELYLINYILSKKNDFNLIFDKIEQNYFENEELGNMYEFLKNRNNNNLSFGIELYSIQNNVEELIEEIKYINVTDEEEFETEYLINIFMEKTKKRILDNSMKEISKKELSADEQKKLLEKTLEDLNNKDYISELSDSSSTIKKYKEYLDNVFNLNKENKNNGLIGISTGIKALNEKIKGLKNQDYIVIGARPSMGKTALVLGFLKEAIFANKNPILFSLEMQKEQIAGRLLPQINSELGMEHTMYAHDYPKQKEVISELLEYLESKNFYIEDFVEKNGANKSKITINDLIVKSKQINKDLKNKNPEFKIDLIIIDYLQLLSGESNRTNISTNDLMSEISKGIKNLGRSYQCPVIALSQLNRDLEKRQDKRPQMSDLRDSGAIEQDADIIMFVYRPGVYLDKEIREQLKKKPNDEQLLRELKILENQSVSEGEIIIGKQRNGPTGIINVEFNKKCSMYGDVNSFYDDLFQEEE